MESMVYGIGEPLMICALSFVSILLFCWAGFGYAKKENKDYLSIGALGLFFLVAYVMGSFAERQEIAGSVRTEEALTSGQVYVMTYCSENKVEGGYLVIATRHKYRDGQNGMFAKSRRSPRVYLLPIKPPTSFYVTEVEGKIKYSDAAEVR